MIRSLILSAILFFIPPNTHADNLFQNDFYKQIDPQLREIIQNDHAEDFPTAIQLADKLIAQYPDKIVGYFFKAAVCDSVIRDYYDYRFKPVFYKAVNKAIELGWNHINESKKKHRTPQIWTRFYLGGALGYRGTQYFYENQFFSALKDGISSVKLLKSCLREDPTLYDVYFGLGCFYYWKSAKAKYLAFLPFISDQRQKGIKYLQLTIKKGTYTTLEAKYALTRIYFNEKRYADGFKLNSQVMKLYPKNVFCLLQRGEALMQIKKWKEASDTYGKLLTLLSESTLHCFERIAEVAYLRIVALDKIHDYYTIEWTYQTLIREKRRREKYEVISERSIELVNKLTKIRNNSGR